MRQAASDVEVAIFLSQILSYSGSATFLDGGGQGNIFVETVCEEKVNWELCFDFGAPDGGGQLTVARLLFSLLHFFHRSEKMQKKVSPCPVVAAAEVEVDNSQPCCLLTRTG